MMIESSNIHPVTTILDNHKDVQALRLDDGEMDALELASLLAVASQCEDLGGMAVNDARSALAAEGVFIWEDAACAGSLPPSRKNEQNPATAAATVTAECWPNPTAGELFIRFSDPAVQGILTVVDAQGRVLVDGLIEYQGKPLKIDLGHAPQGLVLVRVVLGEGRVFSWHVVLQR
jgi:hypothetical protein